MQEGSFTHSPRRGTERINISNSVEAAKSALLTFLRRAYSCVRSATAPRQRSRNILYMCRVMQVDGGRPVRELLAPDVRLVNRREVRTILIPQRSTDKARLVYILLQCSQNHNVKNVQCQNVQLPNEQFVNYYLVSMNLVRLRKRNCDQVLRHQSTHNPLQYLHTKNGYVIPLRGSRSGPQDMGTARPEEQVPCQRTAPRKRKT